MHDRAGDAVQPVRVAQQLALDVEEAAVHEVVALDAGEAEREVRVAVAIDEGLVGDIDSDESLLLAAQRELLEETGWRAGKLEWLLTGPSSSGMSSEQVAFVRATRLEREHAGGGDDSEDIVVHEVPVAEVPCWLAARIAEGYFLDAKLWAGLWLLERNPDGSPA